MNDWRKFTAWALLACTASLPLAGCGGGGSDDDPQPIASSPSPAASSPQPSPARFAVEGFWGGPIVSAGTAQAYSSQTSFWDISATDGEHIALVVLRTGETWIIDIADGIITLVGHGKTQAAGSSITITQLQSNNQYQSTQVAGSNVTIGSMASFNPPWTFNGGYSGYVIPKSQLVLAPGGLSSGGSGGAAAPALNLPTTYDSHYDQPALLTQLAGSYTGTGGTYYSLPASAATPGTVAPNGATVPAAFSALGNNYAITISSTGAVTLPPDPVGCSATGTATPRTDSNVFNLSLQFSGAKCALGNGAKVNGIAVVENGHLLMMAVPPGTTPAGEFVFVSK